MAIDVGIIILLFAGGFLALVNGANDNFKGVATLMGSGTASYKLALIWATCTTLAGSLAAVFLAQKLLVNFSGKGLVPDDIVQLSSFSASVAAAAGVTVFLATRLGFPISTTHAITGALVGVGFMAAESGIHLNKLFWSFLLPLLTSPFFAILGTVVLYPAFSCLRRKMGVVRESCLCLGKEVLMSAPAGVTSGSFAATLQSEEWPQISVGTEITCEERYRGQFVGIEAKSALDAAHFLSAGLVSFARGLNDTPKIAAVLMAGSSMAVFSSLATVAVLIALGALLMARRVAETMSYQITEMNDGQGFSANLVTSAVVIGASQLGMPVSTTHVSCGALFGIGSISGKANWSSIIKILMAWLITLPVAFGLGLLSYTVLSKLI